MFQVLRQRVLLDVFLNVPARQVSFQVLLHHKVQGCLQPTREDRWVITSTPSLHSPLKRPGGPDSRTQGAAGGNGRLPSHTPCVRQLGGEGWGESMAVLPQPPQGPQFNQKCAGTPWVTLNASSLVDAALWVTQPHHVKATFVTHLPWFTGLGSSCNPKASPRNPPPPLCLWLPSFPCTAAGLKTGPEAGKGLTRALKL